MVNYDEDTEEKIKKEEAKKRKKKMKVSGRGVFVIKKTIEKKGKEKN